MLLQLGSVCGWVGRGGWAWVLSVKYGGLVCVWVVDGA